MEAVDSSSLVPPPPPTPPPLPPTSSQTQSYQQATQITAGNQNVVVTLTSRLLGLKMPKVKHQYDENDIPDILPGPEHGQCTNTIPVKHIPQKSKFYTDADGFKHPQTPVTRQKDHPIYDSRTGTKRRHGVPYHSDNKMPIDKLKQQLIDAGPDSAAGADATGIHKMTSRLATIGKARSVTHPPVAPVITFTRSNTLMHLHVPTPGVPSVRGEAVSLSHSVPASPSTSPHRHRKQGSNGGGSSVMGNFLEIYGQATGAGGSGMVTRSASKSPSLYGSKDSVDSVASGTGTTVSTVPTGLLQSLTGASTSAGGTSTPGGAPCHRCGMGTCSRCPGCQVEPRDDDIFREKERRLGVKLAHVVEKSYPVPAQPEFFHQSSDNVFLHQQPMELNPARRRKRAAGRAASVLNKEVNVNAPVFM